MRDGGAITDRSDGAEPAVEPSHGTSGPRRGDEHTRRDLPRRARRRASADPTRQDLPGRRHHRAIGPDTDDTAVLERPYGGRPGGRADHRDRRAGGGDRASGVEYDGGPGGPPAARDDDADLVPAEDGAPGEPAASGAPRRRRRPRWGLRVVALLLLVVFGVPLFAGFRVWYVAREDDRRHSDAIIVLGAAQYNGRPSPVLEWRLLHALRLYREGVAPHIVTVGGNRPGDAYTEAGTGKAWLHEHGVPDDRLVAVPSGSDTLQSMIDVGREYRRLGWHTGVIVTDPPHALRSRTMARDNGIDAVSSPTRSGPTVSTRDTEFNYIVRETGGYLYYEFVLRWSGGS